MPPDLLEIAKWAGAGLGALLTGWQLLERARKAIVRDLSSDFSTKADFQRLADSLDRHEAKLDTVVDVLLSQGKATEIYRGRRRNSHDAS